MNNFDFKDFMYSDLMPINNDTFNPNNLTNQFDKNTENLNIDLVSPYEGYIRGNMFNDEYIPYKDYKPARLTPRSEQQELFLNLSQLAFAAHDINLLLDVNPDNKELIKRFNEYRGEADKAIKTYEQKYGPISLSSDTLNTFPWAWANDTWPWDEGGM